MRKCRLRYILPLITICASAALSAATATDSTNPPTAEVIVDWEHIVTTSKATPSMLVLGGTPMLRHGSPMRDGAFAAIEQLRARYVRYLPFGPYPHLSIPELEPPKAGKTSWDFSLIDPEMTQFLEITKGQEPVVDFGEIPAWMFKTEKPARYPADPNERSWSYFVAKWQSDKPHHKRLTPVDPTGRQIAEYYARIVSWYVKGGFTDENGQFHRSSYHYEIPWWGVLNELDALGPEQYTRLYDAIVVAVRRVSPNTQFIGLALSGTVYPDKYEPEFFEYFLNPKNHRAGVSLDMISYHFYAMPVYSDGAGAWQYQCFEQAKGFLAEVNSIESIRRRLSPATRVDWDEAGSFFLEDTRMPPDHYEMPKSYWNLSGALYAYLYLEAAKRGVDVVSESELTGEPNYYPSAGMLNWVTGRPNARFRVLQLITGNLGPGDKLVFTEIGDAVDSLTLGVSIQGFITARGKKLLIVNQRDRVIEIDTEKAGSINDVNVVDESSADAPARRESVQGKRLRLGPYAVALATIS